MGLGKTLQTISLLGYLQASTGVGGPHLVLVPKTTLANWQKEIKRWCPSLRTLVFLGDRDTREGIAAAELRAGEAAGARRWDVCLATYEVAVIEAAVLSKLPWEYLIIDEAHRIKNEHSALARVVRDLVTSHRLLITGTPLQNNLHELWALLNFLLPDVFASADDFDAWFNVGVADGKDEAAKTSMVRQLHRVLRPFMLRRLKVDVAKSLPPKSESILYCGLTPMQRDVYKATLMRNMDAVVSTKGVGEGKTRMGNLLMHLRKAVNHPYLFDGALLCGVVAAVFVARRAPRAHSLSLPLPPCRRGRPHAGPAGRPRHHQLREDAAAGQAAAAAARARQPRAALFAVHVAAGHLRRLLPHPRPAVLPHRRPDAVRGARGGH